MSDLKVLVLAGLTLLFVSTVSAIISGETASGTIRQLWKHVKSNKDKCPAGEYTICQPCEINKYKPRKGTQRQCGDCKEGMGTLAEGSTKCIKLCNAGNRYNQETSACKLCPLGTYMDVKSLKLECKKCPEHTTTEAEGADSLDKCVCIRGYQPVAGQSGCEACPDGRYKDDIGNSECTLCPGENKISTLSDGAMSKEDCTKTCDPGKELNLTSGTCDACEKNYYKAGISSRERCEPCELNTVTKSKGSASCEVECGPGYQFDTRTGCSQCPWGTYKKLSGNDSPCLSCTVESGPTKVSLARGAKDKPTECIKMSDCFVAALEDLEQYYAIVFSHTYKDDDNIVSALNETCFNDVRYIVNKVMADFMACQELRDNITLPDIKIGKNMYGHKEQMDLVLQIEKYMIANPGKDYCAYLQCVHPHKREILKCKSMMKKDANEALHFCSEPWGGVASCLTLNLLNCPPLKYYPDVADDLDLNGLKLTDIADVGNVLELCGGSSGSGTEGGTGGSSGSGTNGGTGGSSGSGTEGGTGSQDAMVCPSVPAGTIGTCVEACPVDGCKDGKLCCPHGCGHSCQFPVSSEGLQDCLNLADAIFGVLAEMCYDRNAITDMLSCFSKTGHIDTFMSKYTSALTLLGLKIGQFTFDAIEDAYHVYCDLEDCLKLADSVFSVGVDMCYDQNAITDVLSCFSKTGSIDTFMSRYTSALALMGLQAGQFTFGDIEDAYHVFCNLAECSKQLQDFLPFLASPTGVCDVQDELKSAIQCYKDSGLDKQFFESYSSYLNGLGLGSYTSIDSLMVAFENFCAMSGLFFRK